MEKISYTVPYLWGYIPQMPVVGRAHISRKHFAMTVRAPSSISCHWGPSGKGLDEGIVKRTEALRGSKSP